jgi:hypothetical protein
MSAVGATIPTNSFFSCPPQVYLHSRIDWSKPKLHQQIESVNFIKRNHSLIEADTASSADEHSIVDDFVHHDRTTIAHEENTKVHIFGVSWCLDETNVEVG